MQQLRTHATRQGGAPAVQKYLEELEKGTWDEVNYDASGEFRTVVQYLPLTEMFLRFCFLVAQPYQQKCEK